ncbi:MAG: hypothetical protein Ta2B_18810 [Termitinemataceae bacterium]|nr:MAG: hypothetical protein Ta2B_18810 [Termitinemataceae bacterium]
MEFSTLELHADLKKGLEEAGYKTAMPVQEQVINSAFTGRDLYVQSQTGTGKTAAYLIVIFQRLLTEAYLHNKKVLIMVPTRELAVQVEDEAKLIGKYLKFKIGSFYGGVGYGNQQKMLRNDVQILMGTPGRVLDLNASGYMNLMDLGFLVLDEADRMFDMGFYPDLRKLIKVIPSADKRQTMLFSATLNNYVKNLAWEYTKEPVEIEIESNNITVDEIDQVLYHVSSTEKMKLLLGIFKKEQPQSAIIFCNTKRYTEVVAKRLRVNGIKAEFISGDLRQNQRMAIIDKFKAGKVSFLVATDVAARGLDIEGLSLVVNYDLPNESENYVHRIGRTARAGLSGKAVSFACEQDVYQLADIEKFIEKKIPSKVADASVFADDMATTALPIWRSGRKERQPKMPKSRGQSRGGLLRGAAAKKPAYTADVENGNKGQCGENVSAVHVGVNKVQRHNTAGGRQKFRSGKNAPRRDDSRHKSESAQNENLAAMPFEERMKLYKEKYAGGKNQNNGNRKIYHKAEDTACGESNMTVKKSDSSRDGHKASSGNDGKRFDKKRQHEKKGNLTANHNIKKTEDAKSASANDQVKPESGGIVNKIFKIFGTKKKK